MYFEQSKLGVRKDLDYSIARFHHQNKILAFLQSNLPRVAKKLCGQSEFSIAQFNEDDISREITNILNDELREKSGYIFRFEAKSGPDIIIFASPYVPFSPELFIIEAKRLPPTSSRDYVKSGIERFKKEEHGKKHSTASMLGYVQDKDFEYWHHTINLWIDDLISQTSLNPRWENKDKLNRTRVEDLGEYKSTHSRISERPITLYHFWINLCTNN